MKLKIIPTSTGLVIGDESRFTEDDAVKIIDSINSLKVGQQIVYAVAKTGWLESIPYKYGSMLIDFFNRLHDHPSSPRKHSKELTVKIHPHYEFKQKKIDDKLTGIKYFEYIVRRLR